MGNGNFKETYIAKALSQQDELRKSTSKSYQRRKKWPREVHKNLWRAERKAISCQNSPESCNLKEDHPIVSKRATYKKNKPKQFKEILDVKQAAEETTCNGDSLPSRSEALPPDGDSLRSDGERSVDSKCPSCSQARLRLSKAYADKGALAVALDKTQRDLSICQKHIKDLELELGEAKENNIDALTSLRSLETEMCQLQKDKTLVIHELNLTRKQLNRTIELSDVSDSSHVSSVFVQGSRKTSDDGLGEDDGSPVDECDDFGSLIHIEKLDMELTNAQQELQRLKDVEAKKESMELEIEQYEQRIAELEDEVKELNKLNSMKNDSSTQTMRRDGTFTRQSPDKTKIPKRLFAGHHSSLPVVIDGSKIQRPKSATGSLTRVEMLQRNLKMKEKEISALKADLSQLQKELKNNQSDSSKPSQNSKMDEMAAMNERLQKELNLVKEQYKKEAIMRKKFFNLAENLKGKIRVFCRIKPPERNPKKPSFIETPDEYTVLLTCHRGRYEFNFDSVFTAEHSQDDIFRDTQNLVQSAIDGYNVCIFAYGQTGSGKTYTLMGNDHQPGIGPKAFHRIFELVKENISEMDFRISMSVFELYNERLIDLLKNCNEENLKIRKDQYGLVYVQGSEAREVQTEGQLLEYFQEACSNRHTGCTRMNSESSRSHLILSISIESTNKITGTVLKGKLSIVDLAGSERVGKTAVVANQVKEANSINKSLSALGDVIAALSSEQPYVPYRNNKLTLLMQDSLGSNAKTLMFVTISSSENNSDESLNSLIYASRVKEIRNSASRIAESKEIARLRAIIMKLSKSERNN